MAVELRLAFGAFNGTLQSAAQEALDEKAEERTVLNSKIHQPLEQLHVKSDAAQFALSTLLSSVAFG